jgi:hypothetical protein
MTKWIASVTGRALFVLPCKAAGDIVVLNQIMRAFVPAYLVMAL